MALLEEKVRELEQWVATLKAIKEDEVYIDRTLEPPLTSMEALEVKEQQGRAKKDNTGGGGKEQI